LLPDQLDLRRHDLQDLHHAQEEWQCVVVVALQCIQAAASAVAMAAEAAAMVAEDIAKP